MNQLQARNDIFRRSVLSRPQVNGKVNLTQGVSILPENILGKVLYSVKHFSNFTEDNDPHQEHNFGSIQVDGHKVFWKIDYYEDSDCDIPKREDWGEDKSDFITAYRVMTIMLAEEY